MIGGIRILGLGPSFRIVPHDLAGLQIDHLLAYVRAMVGDSLERLGHGKKTERSIDGDCAIGEALLGIKQDLLLETTDGVVEVQHPAGEDRIVLAQGAIRIADHSEDAVGHHAEGLRKIARRAQWIERGLRDGDRAVADPFELVVDLDDREHRADRMRIRLSEGKYRNALLLDLDVDLIDGQLDLQDFSGLFEIVIEVAVDGLSGLLEDTNSLLRDLITENLEPSLKIFGLIVHDWASFLGSIRLWREHAG